MKGKKQPVFAFGKQYESLTDLARDIGTDTSTLAKGALRNNMTSAQYAEKIKPGKALLVWWQRFTLSGLPV